MHVMPDVRRYGVLSSVVVSPTAQKRGAAPTQKPAAATPSTPKSPKRVSPSSSVPYIVRFICAPGVSGGRGSVLLIPSWMPTSVLDTVRRGGISSGADADAILEEFGLKWDGGAAPERSAIATLAMLGSSLDDSRTEVSIGLSMSPLGSTVAPG